MASNSSEIDIVIRGKDELSPQFKLLESKIIRFVGAISATLAGLKLAAAPIIAAAEFERELANVAKTTNFTKTQIDQLSASLLTMSTQVDVSATDLAKIAAAAGQQGLGRYGVQGVEQFTDSVARMSSVLGITAEEAAVNTGKILNIFKIPLAEIEKASSVFNEISNNSTANGKDLLDVVKRIGDAAGALNLQQASTLAATGLDFGISPEVVGTTFNRVFSAAFEKADQFGRLMNISATEWTKKLKEDGLGAFREFLASLRKLDEQSQQKAIVKLVGGGRIGSLLNKLVQDTTDSVLQKNFASAEEGLKGFSALREQQTVLNTLDAQVKILGNSFIKLGIDAAESLVKPLKTYAAQLSEALDQPGVKSFVNAAVKSIGQLVDALVGAIKFVASLNVNWENFLNVLKAYIALNVAQNLLGVIAKMSLFGISLKSIAKDATAAAAATAAVGDAAAATGKKIKGAEAPQFKATRRSEILGYQELSIWNQKRIADLKVEAAAEKAVMEAARQADATRVVAAKKAADAKRLSALATTAGTKAGNAKSDVLFAESAVLAAQNKAQKAREAQDAAFNARQIKAKAYTTNRLVQIEEAYNAKVAALLAQQKQAEAAAAAASDRVDQARLEKAAGVRNKRAALLQPSGPLRSPTGKFETPITRAERGNVAAQADLAAAKARIAAELALATESRAKQLADQKKFQEIALANTQKYYARRIAQLEATGGAEVAAEKAILAARLAAYERFAAAQIAASEAAAVATAAAATAGAAAATAKLEVELAKSATKIGGIAGGIGAFFTSLKATTASAFAGMGLALRTFAGVAAAVGRILLNAFAWVTIIYTILDMTGALDKILPYVQKFTDYLGLTSKAQRDAKVAAEDHTRALEEQAEKTKEAMEAYKAFLDQATQKIDISKVKELVDLQNSGADPGVRQKAAKDLALLIVGAQTAIEQAAGVTQPVVDAIVAENKKIIAEASKDIDDLKKKLDRFRALPKLDGDAQNRAAGLETEIGVKAQAIEDAKLKIAAAESSLANAAANVAVINANLHEVMVEMGKNSTPVSVAIEENVLLPMLQAQEEVAALTKKIEEVGKKAQADGKDVKAAVGEWQVAFENATAKATRLGAAFKAVIAAARDDSVNYTPADQAAVGRLSDLVNLQAQQAAARAKLLAANKTLLTGTNKGTPTPKASGTGYFDPKGDSESRARRLAKARFDFEVAQLRAENALFDERARQQQQADDELYRHGLRALEEYFTARQNLQLKQNQADINVTAKEIEYAKKARSEVKGDPAAVVEFDTKIAQLQGRIDVLQAQRIGIVAETNREISNATKAFRDKLATETNKLFDSGVLPANTQEIFQSNLDSMLSDYQDFLQSIRSESDKLARAGNKAEADRLTALADALVKSFNAPAFERAIQPVLTTIDLTFDRISKVQARAALGRVQGNITSIDAQRQSSDAIKNELPLLQEQLALLEKQLLVLRDMEGVGSQAYLKQVQAIDDLVLRIQQLQVETDLVARGINQNLTDSLTKALDTLEPTFESLKRVILTFLLDITNNLKTLFAKNISEAIIKSLDTNGAGGFGGFFQGLLEKMIGTPSGGAPAQEAFRASEHASAAQKVATSATTAVTTTGVDAAASTAAATALTTLVAPAGEAALGLSAVGLPAGEAALGLGAIVVPAGELLVAFSSLIAPAIEAAAALAAVAASSTAQTVGSVASIASIAHTGGTIGRTPLAQRRVHPSVFANAVRYHTGGIAGLKPDEVPTILQKGERVLTERQQAAAAGGGGGAVNIRSVLVTDPNFVPDAMATAQGERTILTMLQRNKATLRQMVR